MGKLIKLNTPLLRLAGEIAREAHTGQLYGTEPYYRAHILPVADFVKRLGYGEFSQATALLHDTPEDSEISAEQLVLRGIPLAIAHAVDLLDKSKARDHTEYQTRFMSSRLSVVAKFADSNLNLANIVTRQSPMPEEKNVRKIKEYSDNLRLATAGLPEPGFDDIYLNVA